MCNSYTFSILIFSIGFNFPIWFLSSQVGQSKNCNGYTHAINSIPGQIYYWSANISNFFLPFLLLLIMNAVIINTLRNRSKFTPISRAECQSQGQAQPQIQKIKSSEVQIFVMLLLVTFSYLILNCPTYVYMFTFC